MKSRIDDLERLPSESTIQRALAVVDADDLDARVAAWMTTRVGNVAGRRVIAVDGKSMRGASSTDAKMPHLLAAVHQDTAVVAGQLAVAAKSNEIPAPPVLLDQFDLTEVVVTADALHCQRETAAYITGRGGHYVLTVKGNQPNCERRSSPCPVARSRPPPQSPPATGVESGARSSPSTRQTGSTSPRQPR